MDERVTNPFSSGSSFSFTTRQNEGAREVMASRVPLDHSMTLVAEFDTSTRFLQPFRAGAVTLVNGQIVLELDATEVNTIGDGVFRISATAGFKQLLAAAGRISFIQDSGPTLARVAVTGSYSDLVGRPSLAAVAISGDFKDLANAPGVDGSNLATKDDIAAAIHQISNSETSTVYDDLPSLTLLFENGLM